jgi:hypothetical protein
MLAGRQEEIHAERIGSWRTRENSGRFVATKLREERRAQCPGSDASDEVNYLQVGFAGILRRRLGQLYDNPLLVKWAGRW